MFRIEYEVSKRSKEYDSEVVEFGDIFGDYGRFQLYVNDQVYQEFYEGDPDLFLEPIYFRFYFLLEAIILLENSDYILIDDFETINLWVEVKRNLEDLYISIASTDKKEPGALITINHIENTTYKYWKDEKVTYSEFCFEVVRKAERYFLELQTLNKHESKRISYFENKLLEAKEILEAKKNF